MTASTYGWVLGLSLLTTALGLGCGSSGNGSGGDAGPPTFTEVYNSVMVPHGCNAHHKPGAKEDSFLDMSSQANAYKNLVGVVASGPSATAPIPGCGGSGLIRVVPNDAEKSLMYLKVSETKPPCGAQMPFGCPTGFACLTSTETATIAAWINAGAKND
jgi:hypothetical protein